MPNSGHTYLDPVGQETVFKVLPISAIHGCVRQVLIGPGAIFDPKRLMEEWEVVRRANPNAKLRIHPNAVMLDAQHRESEERQLAHISSTMQGSAAARIEKIWRQRPIAIVRTRSRQTHPEIQAMVCSLPEWEHRIDDADQILIEGSQGFSLGIDTQFYPYTTSRNCTPAAFFDAAQVPLHHLRSVYGVCRTLPIRVGNVSGGYSGNPYPDQAELDWKRDVRVAPELTTVTQRERRIFTYSKAQIEQAIWHCAPHGVFLNFANYVGKTYIDDIVEHINTMSRVRWLGWGPRITDVEEIV